MNAEELDPVHAYLAAFGKAMRDPVAIQGLLDSMVARARARDAEALKWLRQYRDRFIAMGYDLPPNDPED